MRVFKPLTLLLLISNICLAQTTPSYTNYEQSVQPPSPNAASLAKFIDYPVSYSTGVPDISIPIYTLKSAKLSVPITLGYHSGGIKVSDISYHIGTGWSLNAGGSISRAMKDIPDEAPNGFFNMIYPDENGNISTLQKDYCLANHISDIYTDGTVKYDGEPDQFYYNFGGLSGSFIFRNRVSPGIDPKAVPIPFSPIGIAWNNQTSFTTTDLNGNIYQFGNTANSTGYSIPQSSAHQAYGAFTNAWYLTKITSADRTDSITFTYEQTPTVSMLQKMIATGVLKYPQIGPANATTAIISYGGGGAASDVEVRIKEITSSNGKVDFIYDSANRLSNIAIYSIVNGITTQIKGFNFYQSSFTTINESAFNTLVHPSGFQRPKLDSIQEIGYLNNTVSVVNPPYKFTYLSTDLPDVFSKSQDFWGFYNGKDNTDMLYMKVAPTTGTNTTFVPAPEKRAIDTAMMKKGLLKRIVYPTGGYTDFLLEPNQINTLITTTTTTPQIVTHHISTFYLQPNDQTTGVSLTFTPNPNINGPVKFDLNGVLQCTPSSSCVANIPEAILYDITANAKVTDSLLVDLYHNTATSQELIGYYTLNPAHQYKIYFPTPGNITTSGEPTQYRIDLIITEPVPSIVTSQTDSTLVFAGGLRIKQIKHNDNVNGSIIKNYNYTKTYFNSTLFQGDFSFIIENLTRSKYIITSGCPIGYTLEQCITGGFTTPTPVQSSITYSEGLAIPVGSASNTSVSYQEVEEVLTGNDGTTLGKNVYTFNTTTDYINPQFPMFRTARDFIRTQLLDTKTYKTNATGQLTLIKDITNTYNNLNDAYPSFPGRDSIKYYQAYIDLDYAYYEGQDNGAALPNASYNPATPYLTSLGCPVYPNNLNYLYHISPFYYHVVKPLLMSTVTTTFDINGANPVNAEIFYNYGNLAHIQPTRITTINSDGRVKIDSMKYPLDYNYQASCNLPLAINNFNQQLSLLKTQRDQCEETAISSDNVYTAAHGNALTSYDNCESTYNSTVASLVSQLNSSIAQYQTCYANIESNLSPTNKTIAFMQDRNMVTSKINTATTVNSNPTLRDSTNYELADVAQNIIRPQQVNIQVSNNPIEARAQFYAYDQAGNLAEQSKTGGPHSSYQWGYNKTYPVAQVDNAASNDIFYDGFEEGDGNSIDSKTGHYSYTGTYSNMLNGLDNGSYVLSYWQKSGTTWSLITNPATVSNGTYAITLGTSSAPVQIDDIRFYPKGALMTTYTYDPLIGMTSTTAPNGKIIYYEYDGLQRLMNIKDEYGNITKHIDYHYQGQ